MYIDSHAHLTVPRVVDHVEEILQRAQQKKVSAVVNICVDAPSLEKGLLLAQRHSWIFNAAATTPHDVENQGDQFFPLVEREARAGHLVAIGETGLDYYYQHSPVDLQKKHLIRYLELAKELKLPVVFHCREAFADLFAITDRYFSGGSAVLHCFTGTLEEAKGCLERGWKISMSGIVTFKKSHALRETAAFIPLESLLIETDTPYLAPQIRRGHPNEPAFIDETALAIAHARGLSLEEVASATAKNAIQFFALPKLD